MYYLDKSIIILTFRLTLNVEKFQKILPKQGAVIIVQIGQNN